MCMRFFPEQVLCSSLHDLRYAEPNRKSFFMRDGVWNKQGWGLRDTVVNWPPLCITLLQLFIICQPVSQGSQV